MGEQLGLLKYFDPSSFQALKDCSHREMIDCDSYDALAFEILTRYEDFEDIRKPPSIRGIPFDYLAFRNNAPHLLVFRDPVNRLRAPSDILRLRLKILTRTIKGLQTAHFQVNLRKSFYRVIYTDEIIQITERLNRSHTWDDEVIKPILHWIMMHILNRPGLTIGHPSAEFIPNSHPVPGRG